MAFAFATSSFCVLGLLLLGSIYTDGRLTSRSAKGQHFAHIKRRFVRA